MLLDQTFNRKYEVLEKVREGGMGSIYKVRHRLLDEVRIVKIICGRADGSSEAFDRFLSEARAAIRLRHPNVAVLYDFALAGDGRAFIVMEFIEGWNLKELLLGYGPPPLHLTLEIARQALLALGYLHRRRIVHRDVAPDNLMLSRDDEGGLVLKLIDLGIAKNLAGSGALTATGLFLGKPRYGSPECLRGEGCDPRSDLYSFGVVLYELLTGHVPIVGNDAASHMAGHLFRPPRPFEETDPDDLVPRDLREIVLRALAKAPEERHPSAEELGAALAAVQGRFPPHRAVFEDVWRVFRPGQPRREGTGSRPCLALVTGEGEETPPLSGSRSTSREAIRPVPAAERTPAEPHSLDATQSLLTPLTRAGHSGEATRRTAAAPAGGAPEGESSRRPRTLGSAEIEVTWARRPLRVAYASEATTETAVPVPAGPAAPPFRAGRRLWAAFAATSLLAAMAVGGTLLVRSRAEGGEGAEGMSSFRPAGEGVGVGAATPAALRNGAPLEPETASGAPAPAEAASALGEGGTSPPAARPRVRRRAPPPPMKPGDMILASQPGVEAPEVRHLGTPLYPPAARGSGRSAILRLRVLVDETGRVIDVRRVGGDAFALAFEQAAREAALQTTFFPASRDGVPGKMATDLGFEFRESPSPAP